MVMTAQRGLAGWAERSALRRAGRWHPHRGAPSSGRLVTASRCCPEVPAPQPQLLRTSPDDLAAELNPHKAIYGELMDSVYLYDRWYGHIPSAGWHEVTSQTEWVCDHWDQPDKGIW